MRRRKLGCIGLKVGITLICTLLSACNISVEIDLAGSGTVTSSDGKIDCPIKRCQYNFDPADGEVILTAKPNPGYHFNGYDNAKLCTNYTESFSTGICKLDPSVNRSITVHFVALDNLCPYDPQNNCLANPNGDFDGDGLKNAIDECPVDNDNNCEAGDIDGDGVSNNADVCPKDPEDNCLANPNGDFDKDGTNNTNDPCPQAMPDTCPSGDLDNDGVENAKDVCPSDKNDACPEGDSDGDKIKNGEDKCPNDPKNLCAAGDADGDGIANESDPCPADPSNNCLENDAGDFDNDGDPNGTDPCPRDPKNECVSLTVSTSKTVYSVGEPVVVTYTDGSGSIFDWVGIYEQDILGLNCIINWGFTTWAYTNGSGGTVTFNFLPVGNYIAQLFEDNTYCRIGDPSSFSVVP